MITRQVEMLDITGPETPVQVEIQDRGAQGFVLYVHVEGMSVLRICQIKERPEIIGPLYVRENVSGR